MHPPATWSSAFEAFAAKREAFPESIQVQIENRAQDYAARRRRPVGRCPLTLGFFDLRELDVFFNSLRKASGQLDASPACAGA